MTKYESVSAAVLLDSITELWGMFVSHCAIEGTSFACDGGGRGGGQFGALSPGFFGGGFFMLACCPRGAGVGWGLVSGTVAGAIGGGGACDLRGGGSFGLENWTVTCSFGWLDLLGGKVLLAVRKMGGGDDSTERTSTRSHALLKAKITNLKQLNYICGIHCK